MKIAIIINSQRLNEELKNILSAPELSKKYDITYDLYILNPAEMNETLKQINYKSYNTIVIGGGDGTVRSAIQLLIDEEIPIAILPLGTFNLLARDLDYVNDIDALFKMIKNNKLKKIDLAEVNGKIIINHAWIGFYYYILKFRNKHKSKIGKSKLIKILFNIFSIYKTFILYKLNLEINNQEISYKTCLVYISNNESNANLQGFAERKTLSSGLLWITILNCHTRWELFKCIFSMIFSGVRNSKYITHLHSNQLDISADAETINVVIDGELFKLNVPLKFTLHPKQLTVVAA